MKKTLPALAAALCLCLLLAFADRSVAGARAGIDLCARVLIPSLFPFLVLSDLAGGAFARRGALGPFLLGVAGGYPLGVRRICRDFSDGLCTREEARRRLFFCSGCGCAFLVGTVGAGLLGRVDAGLLILSSHLLAALVCALAARRLFPVRARRTNAPSPPPVSFFDALRRALFSMARICGLVLLVSAASSVLGPLFTRLPPRWEALARGLCEMTLGVQAAAALEPGPETLALLAGVTGFGGLCVHAQCLGELARARLPAGSYLAGKCLQGVLAAVFCAILARLPFFCW